MQYRFFFIAMLMMIVFGTSNAYASCAAAPFFSDNTQVSLNDDIPVFISFENNRESLVILPQGNGNASNFGIVVPVPSRPVVSEVDSSIFLLLNVLTTPLYCPYHSFGLGASNGSYNAPPQASISAPVQVVEQKEVGDFISTTLTATNTSALTDWLKKNGYQFNANDRTNFDYYIKRGNYYFVAFKMNLKKVPSSLVAYSFKPFELTFDTTTPVLSLRLSANKEEPHSFTLYTLGTNPIVIPGTAMDYVEKLAGDELRSLHAIELNALPSLAMGHSLDAYHIEKKWLVRSTVSLNPPAIKEDPRFVMWLNPTSFHRYTDEDPLTINPESTEIDAGIVSVSHVQVRSSQKTSASATEANTPTQTINAMNSATEKKAQSEFYTIYHRNADMSSVYDGAAISIMVRGLRQQSQVRNLKSESVALGIFSKIYMHLPRTSEEWDIVHAIAYSGATRTKPTKNVSQKTPPLP